LYSGPNPEALALLKSLPHLKKVVFTNCAEKQAREALRVMGLEGEFDAVYGADAMGVGLIRPAHHNADTCFGQFTIPHTPALVS